MAHQRKFEKNQVQVAIFVAPLSADDACLGAAPSLWRSDRFNILIYQLQSRNCRDCKDQGIVPHKYKQFFRFRKSICGLRSSPPQRTRASSQSPLAGMHANLGPCPHIECHECQMKRLSTCPFNFISRHAHRCVAKVLNKYVLQIFDAAYPCYERPLSRSQGAHCMQMKTLLSVRAKSAAHLLHPGPSYPAVPGCKLGPTSLRNEQNLSEFQFQVDV